MFLRRKNGSNHQPKSEAPSDNRHPKASLDNCRKRWIKSHLKNGDSSRHWSVAETERSKKLSKEGEEVFFFHAAAGEKSGRASERCYLKLPTFLSLIRPDLVFYCNL
ncbi:hypothetical protein NE237_007066 [Protea cynaroides]|uniref:Uncharacterized protein n=1 Tax=Protea cynaroides TaxID=273540 RepID=A0A9Q0KNQ2_9MAGN|nr:hypothetical protein NE237_007066 [Protea cynaroides]